MTAEIIYFNSDCECIANAERLGLDPDYELVSLPFPVIQRLPARLVSWRATAQAQSLWI
jgi:hypothetical protein